MLDRHERPLVSVVSPVYNTAPYLSQCIESVLAQTWKNWEYTILDNCSSDGSHEIAERFARKDHRIRVVAADRFRNQAANFNYALTLIAPDSSYTKMVLSDDWLSSDCLEEMVQVGEEHPAVGVIGGFMIWATQVVCQGLPYPSRQVSGRDICRHGLLGGSPIFGTPTSLMFRSKVVRDSHPFFDEDSLSIDTDVCYRILRTWDFGFIHKILSFSRTDNESITSGIIGYDPYHLHALLLLKQYGPEFLSPSELEWCWKRTTHEYFQFLGESVLRGREPAFWAYHARGLALLGYRLDGWRRGRWAMTAFLDLAGNPKRTIERLIGRHQRRRGGPSGPTRLDGEPASTD
jgi:glycosyltransferase involved in cell wall biosynthesis